MAKERFEHFRDELRSAFPIWSKIRKDPKAIGSQFLQVVGISLADIEWVLEYALNQQYITTADLEQTDMLYVAQLPATIDQFTNVVFSSGEHQYEIENNVARFLESPVIRGLHSGIQYNTKCYIDYDKRKLYVHHVFHQNKEHPEGRLLITIKDDYGNTKTEAATGFSTYHVWNFFDEFGLLLGITRLHKEKNYEFRERILDVFRRPASSSKEGLINGIGRELGLTYEMTWQDNRKDLVLDRSRVVVNSIMVEDHPWPEHRVFMDKTGRLTLQANPNGDGIPRKIRFIAGVELHELHDESNIAFQNEIRNIDGTATPLLQYYVEKIQDQVPIMWGQWKWNQGFWDVTNADMTGYGYIPNVYDATFSRWKGYVSKEE